MINKLNKGITGCGKVGHLHAKAIINAKNSQFKAVYCRSRKKGIEFVNHYGVSSYIVIEEMIHKEKLDVAVICTTHPFHKEPAVASIMAGAHVLV